MSVVWLIVDGLSYNMLEEYTLVNNGIFRDFIMGGKAAPLKLNLINSHTPIAIYSQMTGKKYEDIPISGFRTPVNNGMNSIDSFTVLPENSVFTDCLERKETISAPGIPFIEKQIINSEYVKNYCNIYGNMLEGKKIIDLNFSNSRKKNIIIERYELNIEYLSMGYCSFSSHTNSVKIKLTYFNRIRIWLKYPVGVSLALLYISDQRYKLFISDIYYISDSKKKTDCIIKKTGPFPGLGYGKYYRMGAFGSPSYIGGDGTAENYFNLLIMEIGEYFSRLSTYSIQCCKCDINVFYQPIIDEVCHEFYGLRNNNYMHRNISVCLKLVEMQLLKIMMLLKKEDCLIVTSDHGMREVHKSFYINRKLAHLGLVYINNHQEIEVERSKIFYHPCENGSVFINWNNILEDKEEFLIRVEKIFEMMPEIKEVKIFSNTDLRNLYGDLFIVPSKNIFIIASVENEKTILAETYKTGVHGIGIEDSMRGVFLCSDKQPSDNLKAIFNSDIRHIVEKKCGGMNERN